MQGSGWRPIKTAPEEIQYSEAVDLWFNVYASPRSFGISDAYRITDCWREGGKWFHFYRSEKAELFNDYITHWMPAPKPPLIS